MKKHSGWTAVAVAAAVTMMIAGAGPVFAAEKKLPDSSSWQYFEATETGNLPSQEVSKEVQRSTAERGDTFQVVDLGGNFYRIGLDTN